MKFIKISLIYLQGPKDKVPLHLVQLMFNQCFLPISMMLLIILTKLVFFLDDEGKIKKMKKSLTMEKVRQKKKKKMRSLYKLLLVVYMQIKELFKIRSCLNQQLKLMMTTCIHYHTIQFQDLQIFQYVPIHHPQY